MPRLSHSNTMSHNITIMSQYYDVQYYDVQYFLRLSRSTSIEPFAKNERERRDKLAKPKMVMVPMFRQGLQFICQNL